jgi:integrase/recombinase XerD
MVGSPLFASVWNTYIKQFETYLKLERSLSGNTIEAYLRDVEKLAQFSEITLGGTSAIKMSYPQLQQFVQFVAELGMSAHSQARILSGIKSFYKFLLAEEVISDDPTTLLEGPKLGRALPDTLSVEEIEKLLAAIDHSTNEGQRNRAILEVLYSCGLRVSECVDLNLNHLYLEDAGVGIVKVVGKGNKERLVPIGKEATRYLKIYIQEVRPLISVQKGFEGHVFLNRRGKKLTRVMIFTVIKNLAKIVGLKKAISPHTFRHSFATHLVEGGADLRAVQEMLGHESITTTEIYTHLDRDYLRSVVQQYHPRS